MSPQPGDTTSDFPLDSTDGPIHFHDYIAAYRAMFFSQSKDFTPVCTTEIGAFATHGRV